MNVKVYVFSHKISLLSVSCLCLRYSPLNTGPQLAGRHRVTSHLSSLCPSDLGLGLLDLLCVWLRGLVSTHSLLSYQPHNWPLSSRSLSHSLTRSPSRSGASGPDSPDFLQDTGGSNIPPRALFTLEK